MNTPKILQILAGLCSTISPHFFSKHPHKIVFTSFHGRGFRGNTKVIFEEMCHRNILDPVWLSVNSSIVNRIRNKYGKERAFLAHSPAGLAQLAKAGAVVFTHGTSDFPFLKLPRRAMRIQTYHGLPTKRGEYLRPKDDKEPGWLHKKVLEYRFRPITHFLSSSEEVTDVFSRRFNISKDKFLEIGYPVYDELMRNEKCHYSTLNLWPEAPHSDSVILYAPTFRILRKTRWFPFSDKDLHQIAEFLETKNALMAIRAHPNENFNYKKLSKISNRFVVADQSNIENINDVLLITDVIVTDYSSIYIEGFLKDIPAVFLPYDLQNYERGFAFPYDEVTPGPKAKTQKEFLVALTHALNSAPEYSEERQKLVSRFFSKTDGKSTDRFISFLKSNLRINNQSSEKATI